jgi:hypothetical protein
VSAALSAPVAIKHSPHPEEEKQHEIGLDKISHTFALEAHIGDDDPRQAASSTTSPAFASKTAAIAFAAPIVDSGANRRRSKSHATVALMNGRHFWELGHISDDELLSTLDGLIVSERQVVARVVAHIAEVEMRRLHLRAACSSLFDYCLRKLRFSEGEAFRRVAAARMARRYPVIFGLLESGALHLSALCLLRDHLTNENHTELLREASNKTKRQVEELVARRFPKPEVASFVRKLPERSAMPDPIPSDAPAPTPATTSQTDVAHAAVPTGLSEGGVAGMARTQNAAAVAEPLIMPAAAELPAPRSSAGQSHAARIEPLSADRYRLQLNASSSLKSKLELARDLMRHSNPEGDLGVIVERGLDLLIDQLQRQRFALTSRPRNAIGTIERKRRISNATRREVLARDGLQCSYVDEQGERCPARGFLELHHEQAWARGGSSTAENIRVLCRAHNRLLAERDFGEGHVTRAIERNRPSAPR